MAHDVYTTPGYGQNTGEDKAHELEHERISSGITACSHPTRVTVLL
jgi:hypothetical protein